MPPMLTIQQVKNAKAADKPQKLYDRDGLYLYVTPAGGKLWRGKYRPGQWSRENLQHRPLPESRTR